MGQSSWQDVVTPENHPTEKPDLRLMRWKIVDVNKDDEQRKATALPNLDAVIEKLTEIRRGHVKQWHGVFRYYDHTYYEVSMDVVD
jgi:hypothetical protein